MTNPFTSKTKPRKKWRRKALLIDPHKSKLILIATRSRQPANHVPPWILQKLLQTSSPQMQDKIIITPAEYALADRLRQEMLERESETPRPKTQPDYSR